MEDDVFYKMAENFYAENTPEPDVPVFTFKRGQFSPKYSLYEDPFSRTACVYDLPVGQQVYSPEELAHYQAYCIYNDYRSEQERRARNEVNDWAQDPEEAWRKLNDGLKPCDLVLPDRVNKLTGETKHRLVPRLLRRSKSLLLDGEQIGKLRSLYEASKRQADGLLSAANQKRLKIEVIANKSPGGGDHSGFLHPGAELSGQTQDAFAFNLACEELSEEWPHDDQKRRPLIATGCRQLLPHLARCSTPIFKLGSQELSSTPPTVIDLTCDEDMDNITPPFKIIQSVAPIGRSVQLRATEEINNDGESSVASDATTLSNVEEIDEGLGAADESLLLLEGVNFDDGLSESDLDGADDWHIPTRVKAAEDRLDRAKRLMKAAMLSLRASEKEAEEYGTWRNKNLEKRIEMGKQRLQECALEMGRAAVNLEVVGFEMDEHCAAKGLISRTVAPAAEYKEGVARRLAM